MYIVYEELAFWLVRKAGGCRPETQHPKSRRARTGEIHREAGRGNVQRIVGQASLCAGSIFVFQFLFLSRETDSGK